MRWSVINLVAFDPGGTTGLAHYTNEHDINFVNDTDGSYFVYRTLRTMQFTPVEALDYLRACVTVASTECKLNVVYERFVPRGRTRARPHQKAPLDVIGGILDICRSPHVTCISQGPSEAKKVGTPTRLQPIGFWTPHMGHV